MKVFRRLRSWTGSFRSVWRLNTCIGAGSSTATWNPKMCSWQLTTQLNLAISVSVRCLRIRVTLLSLSKGRPTTCRQRCVSLNPTLIHPTCGRWGVSFMSCALCSTHSALKTCLALFSKLFKTSKNRSPRSIQLTCGILWTVFWTKIRKKDLKFWTFWEWILCSSICGSLLKAKAKLI